MANLSDIHASNCEPVDAAPADLTGRERMTRNVLTSWCAHFVFVIAGFIMPRLIDGHLGQQALGVWDFAWSFVAYFGLVQAGLVTSVNRYVAKYRAVGDTDGVNRSVSSASCVLIVMGAVVLGLTVAATLAIPRLFSTQLGEFVGDARWVVLLLGLSLVVQIVFSGFGGVITGCHRWDLHNAIEAGSHVAIVAGMIGVLFLGGGLAGLALVNLCGQALGRGVRCVIAYRVFRGLHVRLAYANWSEARRMLTFGGKSFVLSISELLLRQATNILILAYLGPAAVALYARPRALVHHVSTFVRKYTYVLGPIASSLHAAGQTEQLRDLFLKGGRYAAYIALPPILTLAILGDPILRLWMGPRYAHGLLLAILAAGHLPSMVYESAFGVMWGMNTHGRPALANLVAAICGVGMTILALGPLQWGLLGAALAVTIPPTVANGIYLPVYAARQLDISVQRYLLDALRRPVLCTIPFGLCLIGARLLFAGEPLAILASGGAAGGVTLGLLYWKYALPHSLKDRIRQRAAPLRADGATRVTRSRTPGA